MQDALAANVRQGSTPACCCGRSPPKGRVALLLAFSQVAFYAACIGKALRSAQHTVRQRDRRFESQRHQLVPLIAAGWG
jgi:hypothetical protein